MKNEFDMTIDVLPNEVHARGLTPIGSKFLEEAVSNGWQPDEVVIHIPPGFRLGVRTNVRKKFALIPPPSLH